MFIIMTIITTFLILILGLATWINDVQDRLIFKEVERLNDTHGGDWYYDEESGSYRDSMTDKVIS